MQAARCGITPPHFWQVGLWELEAVFASSLRADRLSQPAAAPGASNDQDIAMTLRSIGGDNG